MTNERTLIFISHANPEDNPFVTWLASRLSLAGYNAWADIAQLRGGERFWKDIEDAIRNHAVKVIVVLSKNSVAKDGVRNEIHMASETGKTLNDAGFIIPLKLDDVASNQIPAQLVQLNYIPFDVEWAAGLTQLLDGLQKAHLPCSPTPEAAPLAAWCSFHTRLAKVLRNHTETVISNWFEIKELPPTVYFYGFEALQDQVTYAKRILKIPYVEYLRLIMSFVELDKLQPQMPEGVRLKVEYSISTDEFLAGKSENKPPISATDARRMMVNLLRQIWERHAEKRGLRCYPMATHSAWYVPQSLPNSDHYTYVDPAGHTAWRALTGRSDAKNFYWHLGLDPLIRLHEPRSICFRTHVILTNDGEANFLDKKIMHRRRRGFCKNWWNPRWQGMILAVSRLLAGDENQISLDTGGKVSINIDIMPIQFQLPVSLSTDVDETELDKISGADEEPEIDDIENSDENSGDGK